MEDQHSKQRGTKSTDNQRTTERTGNSGDQPYKNVETSVDSPERFDDDFEVQQEDEMRSGEAKSEQETRENEPR